MGVVWIFRVVVVLMFKQNRKTETHLRQPVGVAEATRDLADINGPRPDLSGNRPGDESVEVHCSSNGLRE